MISRATFVLPALLALALAGCGTTSAPVGENAAAPAPTASAANPVALAPRPNTPQAFVRLVNVVPGGPEVKLQADGKAAGGLARFGNASTFAPIEPGRKIKITALAASGALASGPMPVDLKAGDELTVVVNGVPGDVALLPFKSRDYEPGPGRCTVRFAHAAKGLGTVQAGADSKFFGRQIKYGQDTDPLALDPGAQLITASYSRPSGAAPAPTPTRAPGQISPQPTPARLRDQVSLDYAATLKPGKSYILILFYDSARLPKLRLLDDSFTTR